MTKWNDSIMAQTGSGKTTTTIETLVRMNGNEELLEWIDPKGNTTTARCPQRFGENEDGSRQEGQSQADSKTEATDGGKEVSTDD